MVIIADCGNARSEFGSGRTSNDETICAGYVVQVDTIQGAGDGHICNAGAADIFDPDSFRQCVVFILNPVSRRAAFAPRSR